MAEASVNTGLKTEFPSVQDLARHLLGRDFSELEVEEQRVIQSINERGITARDTAEIAKEQEGFGARLSDRVAAVGGSWSFIVSFALILLFWMLLNSEVLQRWGMAFDPYPFIFLNLMLSTLAAVQAPIIMMSQNRQAAKDRIAAAHDYEVNLRAELEIKRLHHKIAALADDIGYLRKAAKAEAS
ncbi:MAG: DUF1003 domain-containing protein [Sphingorhabdus sp.]